MPREVRQGRERHSAKEQRKARLLQFALARLTEQRGQHVPHLRVVQFRRHSPLPDLPGPADEPLRLRRPIQERHRRVAAEHLARRDFRRLHGIFPLLPERQIRGLRFALGKQALAERAQLRIFRAAPIGQFVHHMHKLARVHRAEEIAVEAVGQHEPRILLRHARRAQRVVDAKQPPHLRVIDFSPRRIFKRRDPAAVRKIDISARLHRERGQPELDQKLLRQHRDILKRQVDITMFQHGRMPGRDDLADQPFILLFSEFQ